MLDVSAIIKVGGRDFVLRPSFKAFAKIQQKLGGERVLPLLKRIAKEDLGVEDVAIVAHALAEAGGNMPMPSFDDFAEMLMADGALNFMGELITVLRNGCTGPVVESGKAPTQQETLPA